MKTKEEQIEELNEILINRGLAEHLINEGYRKPENLCDKCKGEN